MTLGTNRKIPSFVSDCAEYFPGRFKEITNSLPSESARTRAAAGCEGKFRMGSALDGTLARLDFGSKQVAATGMKRIYADMDMQRGKDEAETKRDPFAKSTNQKPSPVRPKLEQGSYSDMNDLKSLDLKSLVIKRNELSSLIKYEGNQGKKETLERRIRLVEEELQAKRTKEAEAKEAALHKSWLDHAKQEQARVNMEKMDAAKLAVRDKNRDFSNLASTAPRSEDPYDLDVLITGTMADQPSTLKQQQQLLGCLSKNTRGAKVAKMAADGHYGTAAIQTPKLRADAQRPKRRSPIDDSNFYGNRQRPSTRSSMGMNFGSKSGSIRRRCEGCDQDCTVQPHRQDNTIYLCAMCRKNNGQTPSRPLRRSGRCTPHPPPSLLQLQTAPLPPSLPPLFMLFHRALGTVCEGKWGSHHAIQPPSAASGSAAASLSHFVRISLCRAGQPLSRFPQVFGYPFPADPPILCLSMSQSVTKFHKEKDGPVEILDDTTDEEPETPNKPLPIPEDISASGGIRKSLRLGASQDPLWRRLAGLKVLPSLRRPLGFTPCAEPSSIPCLEGGCPVTKSQRLSHWTLCLFAHPRLLPPKNKTTSSYPAPDRCLHATVSRYPLGKSFLHLIMGSLCPVKLRSSCTASH